jgi:hypothetical protein
MPPRKKKTVRRRKSLTSLIDVGTSVIVANATTQAFFGTNVWEFFTAGWFGRPNAANSWRLSLNELVMGAIDPSTRSGMSASYQASSGITGAIKKNMKDNGAQAIATIVLAPVAAKMVKRLARKPIADMNKLARVSGISSATGVKI